MATKAAWVLARVERDRRLHQLASLYKHDTGTGYLSDFKTREYLRIFIPKLSRHAHPVNMIRYHGWSRKMIAGWREIEEYNLQLLSLPSLPLLSLSPSLSPHSCVVSLIS